MSDELSMRVGAIEGGVKIVLAPVTEKRQPDVDEINKYLIVNGSGKKRCSIGGVCLVDRPCLCCNIAYLHENHKL